MTPASTAELFEVGPPPALMIPALAFISLAGLGIVVILLAASTYLENPRTGLVLLALGAVLIIAGFVVLFTGYGVYATPVLILIIAGVLWMVTQR